MRKLLYAPVLAFSLAIPPAVASPGERKLDDVPALVDISRMPAAPDEKAPGRAPSPRSAFRGGDSEDAPALIESSVAGDPLDHQEARSQLLRATRGAQRDVARRRQAAAERKAASAAAARGPAAPDAPDAPEAPASGPSTAAPHLEAIAACESGGDPAAVGDGGAYRGKYQFSPATWQAMGGTGDPAAAPEAEQDRRAAALYAQSGPSQWPNCAR